MTEEWTQANEGSRQAERDAEYARQEGRGNGQDPAPPHVTPFTPLDWAKLAGETPPPREFVVDQWIPRACVTSLYGPGGVGKSLLALIIAISVAMGRPWNGCTVSRGPVLGLFSEDDDDELWRRVHRIARRIDIDFHDLNGLHVQGRVAIDDILVTFRAGEPAPSLVADMVITEAKKCDAVLIILDNIAQLFGGQENDRFEATYFLNLVARIAKARCGSRPTPTALRRGVPGRPQRQAGRDSGGVLAANCRSSRLAAVEHC